MSGKGVRCWQFDDAPQQVRLLFLGRKSTLPRRPRPDDWVLEVMPDAVLPVETTNSIVVRVQTRRQKERGNGHYFALVSGSTT